MLSLDNKSLNLPLNYINFITQLYLKISPVSLTNNFNIKKCHTSGVENNFYNQLNMVAISCRNSSEPQGKYFS